MDKIPLIFQAQITQNSPMENSGFTLCRARVFYTGLNRNGSYITKEFAESFISTAIGCPVVGLWDYEAKDFTDHSLSDRKKAYGFIPENPEFAWENSLDYDGVEREYASFNVVLWTKAFEEANEIIYHPLSMEINSETINGDFKVINGEYCFQFTSAEMLGICVLGYNVEPCFEGARFLSVDEMKEFKRLFKIDKQQALLSYNTIINKGETSMEEEKEKELTPTEDFAVIRDDDIEEVIDASIEDGPVEEFTNNEEITEPIEEVNTEFVKIKEQEKEVDSNTSNLEEIKEFQKHIEELEKLNEDFQSKIAELESKVSELEQTNFSLNEYKDNKIKEEKQNIINNYKEVLTEEEINNINIDKFSVEDLNDKLAAMAYRKIANHDSANFQLINTDFNKEDDDVDSIIRKYKEN
jgi:hypothetical protein